jgi:LmbE family N-acetylglucosaminyl deacetylase
VPSGAEAITAIDDAISRTEAKLVYTHAPDDTHQDHRATSIASLAAARRVSTVLYYETASTQHFQPTLFVDVDEALEPKLDLLRTHLAHVLRDGPVDLEAVIAQARFRGSQSRVRHAEAFETARFVWDLVPATAHDDAVLDALEAEPAAAVNEVRSIEQAVRELVR